MSLKAFHIVFVTVSILLTVSLSAWGFSNYFNPGGAVVDLAYGVLFAVSALALAVYGKYFLRKLKHISYL